ncbi:MAG: enoyl-CoA hydratase [Myxococcota bacterium]|jgi:enoyl-CoA hydratase
MSYVELETIAPHVALLRLNRPDRVNALSYAAVRELHTCLDGLADQLDTRVVILTGAGRGFCAGYDIKAHIQGENGEWEPGLGDVQAQYRMQQGYANLVLKLRRLPQPVIAAVNGPAAGGGLSLALACDLRVASEEARFNCAFVRLGLGGAELGTAYFLPKLLGSAMAAELMYTGRMVAADEALRVGLVSRVVSPAELLDCALELAREMVATTSPFGLRATKEVLDLAQSGLSLDAIVHLENRNQVLARQTADARAAAAAWVSGTKPTYQDT